jgi:phage terminase large subunit-like protein
VPRRKKRIVDLVRDETFLARKDEHLLGGLEKLPWRELEKQRRRFRAAAGDKDARREIALELERGLRERGAAAYLGDLRADLAKFGPPGSLARIEGMGRRYFRHYAGPKAGKPFVFDRYQRQFLAEDTRRDKHGRVYQVSLLMAPKGSGKTPFGAVIGAEAFVSAEDAPEVYNIAGAKDQAGFCWDFAAENIRDSALAGFLEVGSETIYDITKPLAEWSVMTADGDLSAGVKPTKTTFDELFQFVHRKQREQWNSHAKALHKRPGEASILAMSTAGWDKQTLLGEMYDAAIAHPKLEVLNDGYLLVVRDVESGFLFWCYQAPDDADIENPKVIRAANPAPWVSPRDLLKELNRADTREADWRRLHLNQWTAAKEAWLPAGRWRALGAETEIPRGADIYVAVDAAKKYDTTACAWAYKTDSGGIVLRAKVWSAREATPYHEFVPGGRIRNSLVEDFIAETLATEYSVREVVYDPRYFDTQGERLAERGLVVAEFPQASAAMADAYQHFYEACLAGTIVHNGDAIFAAHVDAAAAVLTETGWRVYKLRSTNPIDALVAAAMARERAARGAAGSKPFAFIAN